MMVTFFRSLTNLYSWQLPGKLLTSLAARRFQAGSYLRWFWQTQDFSTQPTVLTTSGRFGAFFILLGMATQVFCGVALLVDWARFGTAGSWEFGLALLLSYPLIWAHVLAITAAFIQICYYMLHPKKLGRSVVCGVLERQVKKLRKAHTFRVVAVAGSVGKTSTKLAIATVLGTSHRVRHQAGNYNDRVTVPLVFFGHTEPSIINIFAWLKIFRANTQIIKAPYPYDIVVIELGTDGPGFMQEFAYIEPDITVLTAITPEHMEYFKTLDAVAVEELAVFDYSKRVLVNGDDVAGKYLAGRDFSEYSLVSDQAAYAAKRTATGLSGQTLSLKLSDGMHTAKISLIGEQGAKFALAAASVADMLGVKYREITKALGQLEHFSGRMQVLPGKQGSKLIDDTYNASPMAVTAALDVLYAAKTSTRIAILGSMNELGAYSPEAHREVGEYCNAKKIDIIITIGKDAQQYLAPAAIANGCAVKSFVNPYEAGRYAFSQLKKGAVVLAKGSQNGVFAEEALKPLLASQADAKKLVRQSPYWLAQKMKQFP